MNPSTQGGAPEPPITDLDIMLMLESVLINDEVINVQDAHKAMIALRDYYEAAKAESYAAGMQEEREHQEALARLVMQTHRAEIAQRDAKIAALEARLAEARKWLPDSALESEDE